MKSKTASVPNAPTFQPDPNVAWSQDFLKGQANYLINGLTSDQGLSGLLGETVSFNPMTTQYALDSLQAQLAPSYRTGRQDLINTLEANNQLTGSTTGNSLQNYENDYLSQLTAVGAEAALADINRALQNRVSLYGTGLNTGQAVGSAALQNQEQMNQFALQNYENQVAAALMNQPTQRGGLTGALTGGLGGAATGAMIGSVIPGVGTAAGAVIGGGLGAAAGGFGSPGTGGQLLGAGAGMYGNKVGGSNLYSQGLGQSSIYNAGTGESINSTLGSSRLTGSLSAYYPY